VVAQEPLCDICVTAVLEGSLRFTVRLAKSLPARALVLPLPFQGDPPLECQRQAGPLRFRCRRFSRAGAHRLFGEWVGPRWHWRLECLDVLGQLGDARPLFVPWLMGCPGQASLQLITQGGQGEQISVVRERLAQAGLVVAKLRRGDGQVLAEADAFG
jgi:hypothetical protein